MLQRSGEWKDISARIPYHVRFWNSNHKKQMFDQLRSRNTDYKLHCGNAWPNLREVEVSSRDLWHLLQPVEQTLAPHLL